MTDQPDPTEAPATQGPAGETPAQKALRLKNAKLDARPKPPRGGRFQREQAAGIAAGANRPWTHK
ncbi:hypothetical protein [Brevundimonas sp. NIBR11]|uniref:hypothetical protein n=1 Tax=Brevundimonas sp. NIBR11 TaxID=3015999 RepID=UPI0022F0C4F8|nr:hypothetical protein [Brevundimonas sp. NIBR11]WGM30015.1 hypothetical protein KKHFBJBL_00230 [Brevundimonas sp. NIBR11]